MDEFWKFIFGQNMAPPPEQPRKPETGAGRYDPKADEAAKQGEHERRKAQLAAFNAFLDASEEERRTAPRGWKVRRPGENVFVEAGPTPDSGVAQGGPN